SSSVATRFHTCIIMLSFLLFWGYVIPMMLHNSLFFKSQAQHEELFRIRQTLSPNLTFDPYFLFSPPMNPTSGLYFLFCSIQKSPGGNPPGAFMPFSWFVFS
ncbi:MAG: hypothetical protein IIZ39_12895, partial [Blautia sp.]|nr:hypothetical protein [Blautia sp.]